MITKYKSFLSRQDLAANTVRSYVWTVTHFLEKYKEVTRENLLAYKGYLVENHKPQTVKPAPTGHQQVSGVYQKGETQNALRKSAAEKLSRKRNQRC